MTTALRTYKKRDKRKFLRVHYEGSSFVSEPCEAHAFIANATVDEQDHGYSLSEAWMTQAEFEALPDFGGF